MFVDHDAIWNGTCHLVDCSVTTIICRSKINMMIVQKIYNGKMIIIFILLDNGKTIGNSASYSNLYNLDSRDFIFEVRPKNLR